MVDRWGLKGQSEKKATGFYQELICIAQKKLGWEEKKQIPNETTLWFVGRPKKNKNNN